MWSMLSYVLETRKELLVGLSLSILYLTYYLVEVVKKPLLYCRDGPFKQLLENDVPVLSELYRPTPWCVEGRLQTVLGSILRSLFLPKVTFSRQVVKLRDGGQVALDWAAAERARAVLLLLPGLTGGAHADYARCLAAAARRLRATLVVFHNRGLGGLPLSTPRLYCAVSHEDLADVALAVGARAGGAPLLAVGVSLGGLILGQYLAAQGPRARLHAALVISSPLDVVRGSECMERPVLNALLSWHMARGLRRTVRGAGLARGCRRVARARSVRDFDDAFTANHFGFDSVDAYYRSATLHDKLDKIAVPLLCLCAADDPFQPGAVLPAAAAARSARVALAVPARGGHIGFLEGWWPPSGDQYITRVAHQYFEALLARPDLLHEPPKDAELADAAVV